MGLCCLFDSEKRYAYEIEKGVYGGYYLERVIVKQCDFCDKVKLKRPSITGREYQYIYCDTMSDVVEMCKANGIPLLGEVIGKK